MKKVGQVKLFRSKSENNNDPGQNHLSTSADNNDNLLTSKGLLRSSRSSLKGSNPLSPRTGSSERPVSILGNSSSSGKEDVGSLFKHKGFSNLFQRGTLTRNKKVCF